MKLQIHWNAPLLPEDDILQIQPTDLDDFYDSASDYDKSNLFFVLLASFHHCMDRDEKEKAAHLCFLMAYYLFITLTPPASWELAKHYIAQAVALHPLDLYREWQALIEKGN